MALFGLFDFPEAQAALLIPLLEGKHVVGCVTIATSRPDEFSEADEQALGKLAPEIVLAVQTDGVTSLPSKRSRT